MTVIEGVDYSTSVPTAAALVAAGKRFAVRYGGPGSSDKHLSPQECRALTGAGIAVVANAEGAAGGFTGTAAGRSWAGSAHAHFSALGMPDDRPIYFSVDWDAGSADWPGIDAALRGAAQVIGAGRVGVYGGYATIAHCHSAGTAAWLWQTYAWSGSPTRWHPAGHLQQYHNGVSVGGADCDLTRAIQDDYGQWGVIDMTDVTVDLTQVVPDSPYATKRVNGLSIGAFVADQENLRDFLIDAEGTPVPTGLGGFAPGYPADTSSARIALLCARVKEIAVKVDALTVGTQVTIPQAQIDLAVLNALKTLAGGQA